MKRLLFVTFLITLYSSSFAQSLVQDTARNEGLVYKKPHVARIGFTPSALLNIYPSLQVNGAINLTKNFQFHIEAGRIFYSITSNEDELSGFRMRPGLRYYFSEIKNFNFHMSLAYNYRSTQAKRIGFFNVLNIPNVLITEFRQDRVFKGLASVLGVDYWIHENFILDLGVGLGFSRLVVMDQEIPEDSAREFLDRVKYDTPGQYDIPLFIVNVRIQYLF